MDLKKRRYRYTIITVLATIVGSIALLGTMELTSKPTFCSSCHYMEPYIEAWKTSSHSDVTCTDCHFPPGFKHKIKGKLTAASMVVNYMTGIYKKSKPWAEISDASCLRSGCHEERLLSGKVLFKDKIHFDHEPHLTDLRRGKQLRCTSCHSQIVQGVHISVTETTCFTCHFKNTDSEPGSELNDCQKCHEAPVDSEAGPALYDHTLALKNEMECKKCHGEMQVGDGAVPRERCNTCHADIEAINRYDEDIFIHQTHVTDHKVECQNCHSMIQHKSINKSKDMITDCGSCHENTHSPQYALFSGTGGKNIKDHPNPMFDSGLTCEACHLFHDVTVDESLGHVSRASYESCDICHGSGYYRILEQWENVMDKKVTALESLVAETKSRVEQLSSNQMMRVKNESALKDADYNIKLVRKGNIVHNVAYSDELLLKSFDHLSKINSKYELGVQMPDYQIYGSKKIPSECSNCHYGIEDVSVELYGLKFSHQKHIVNNGQSCYKCHSNRIRHGEMKMSKSDCISCHHTQKTVECEQCHTDQAAIYDGSAFSHGEADIMYDEDISCTDCHENDEGQISKETIDNCVSCHDDSYEDTLYEVQVHAENLLKTVKEKLKLHDADDAAAKQAVSDYDKITEDGSLGAHNPELVLSQLQNIIANIEAVSSANKTSDIQN